MYKQIFSVLLFIISYTATSAVDITDNNYNYLYDGTLDIKHQLVLKHDTFFIYLEFNNLPHSINYLYQTKYKDKQHVLITTDTIGRSQNGKHCFQAKFSNKTQYNLLVLELKLNERSYYYDIPINKYMPLGYPDFSLMNANDSIPFLNNYLQKGKNILSSKKDSLYGYAYQQNFERAASPMMTRRPAVSKNLLLDSVFIINDTISLDHEQLLFVQRDSSTNVGRGFITVPNYYPRQRLAEELVLPLVYISTKEEYGVLSQTENKKKSFDDFWISRVINKERAKKSIKKYYQHVTKSNMYFTNYKEGWKTDQGMVYIIFGAPMSVYRDENQETWSYYRFGEWITFNFEKIPNLFVRQHKMLQRDKAYSKVWFREISSWRKGNL